MKNKKLIKRKGKNGYYYIDAVARGVSGQAFWYNNGNRYIRNNDTTAIAVIVEGGSEYI